MSLKKVEEEIKDRRRGQKSKASRDGQTDEPTAFFFFSFFFITADISDLSDPP